MAKEPKPDVKIRDGFENVVEYYSTMGDPSAERPQPRRAASKGALSWGMILLVGLIGIALVAAAILLLG